MYLIFSRVGKPDEEEVKRVDEWSSQLSLTTLSYAYECILHDEMMMIVLKKYIHFPARTTTQYAHTTVG